MRCLSFRLELYNTVAIYLWLLSEHATPGSTKAPPFKQKELELELELLNLEIFSSSSAIQFESLCYD